MKQHDNQIMLQCLARLLPPIIRLAVANGMDSRSFCELTKQIFVRVITEDYGRAARPTNIARTAMLAGLSRAETRRIRKRLDEGTSETAHNWDHGFSTLLREWHTDSIYLNSDGQPLKIPYEGDDPCFKILSKKYFADIPATTVLKELEQAGAVRRAEDNTVEVQRDYFMPPPIDPRHLSRIGEVIGDFAETVLHNYSRGEDEPSRVELRTYEEEIDARHEAALYALLDEECGVLYRRVDAWLRDKRKYECLPDEKKCRMGFGIYQIYKANEEPK